MLILIRFFWLAFKSYQNLFTLAHTMGLFDKLLNLIQSDDDTPSISPEAQLIRFGRYSDNNKTLAKTKQWYVAEDLYTAKNFNESIEAFFDYLRDENEDNVRLVKQGNGYTFELFQGTKIVKGEITETDIRAHVSLALMEKPSIPVMRRLLEMNFLLYYSRFALHEQKLCMLFDSPKNMASPSKLYYGLKELATKADKQDDLLLTDFSTLQAVDDTHVTPFLALEKEVKYTHFKQWIEDTLAQVETLNQDSFSGGIAYLLLSLIYRLDFMLMPEGKLLNEIERINNLYWSNKEEKTAVERNQLLKDAFRKLVQWPKDEVLNYFYRAKATFAITIPKPYTDVADSIRSSKENMQYYKDTKQENIVQRLLEYGLAYPQYSYSLPKPVTDLFTLFMQVNHSSFFDALGLQYNFVQHGQLNEDRIRNTITSILNAFKDKYPKLNMSMSKLDFSSIPNFNLSLVTEMESLNFEPK